MSHFDDFTNLANGVFNHNKLILPLLTAIGAWGGFPKGPKSFEKLSQNKFFQYFFLWILIVQGGSNAEFDISLIAVIIVFILTEFIMYIEKKFNLIEDFKNIKSINDYPILYRKETL